MGHALHTLLEGFFRLPQLPISSEFRVCVHLNGCPVPRSSRCTEPVEALPTSTDPSREEQHTLAVGCTPSFVDANATWNSSMFLETWSAERANAMEGSLGAPSFDL